MLVSQYENIREKLDIDCYLNTLAGQVYGYIRSIWIKTKSLIMFNVVIDDVICDKITNIVKKISEYVFLYGTNKNNDLDLIIMQLNQAFDELVLINSNSKDKQTTWTLGYEKLVQGTNNWKFVHVGVTDPNNPYRTTEGQVWDMMYAWSGTIANGIEQVIDEGLKKEVFDTVNNVLESFETILTKLVRTKFGSTRPNPTLLVSPMETLIKNSIPEGWLSHVIYWVKNFREFKGTQDQLFNKCLFVNTKRIAASVRKTLEDFTKEFPTLIGDVINPDDNTNTEIVDKLITSIWMDFVLRVYNAVNDCTQRKQLEEDKMTYAQIENGIYNGCDKNSLEWKMFDQNIVKWAIVKGKVGVPSNEIPITKALVNGRMKQINVIGMNVCEDENNSVIESSLHVDPHCLLMDLIKQSVSQNANANANTNPFGSVDAIVFQRSTIEYQSKMYIGWHIRLVTTKVQIVKTALENSVVHTINKKTNTNANVKTYPIINLYT
jgi:hypothetical protein